MKKIFLLIWAIGTITILACQNNNPDKNQPKRLKARSAAEWKKILSPEAYDIMVNSGTETPFNNPYWNNHQKGIYVSAATGDTLFTSADKFDSGTGWPSFVKPVDPKKIEIRRDASFGMVRDEVIEKSTGLHLGHVFDDGPVSRGGKRYCMNSYAFKFIKQ